MTRTRLLRPLTALVIFALIGAGCSGAPAESDGGATAGNTPAAPVATGTSNGSGSTAGSANNAHGTAVRFAECMRDNGVKDFPDPDASGALTIDAIANGSSVDTDSGAFKRAITACKDLEPPGFTGTLRTPEQQKAALKFAQCIRDNGVKDFPDPAPDAPMIDTNLIPSTNGKGGLTILHAAMQKCRGLAAAAGVQP